MMGMKILDKNWNVFTALGFVTTGSKWIFYCSQWQKTIMLIHPGAGSIPINPSPL